MIVVGWRATMMEHEMFGDLVARKLLHALVALLLGLGISGASFADGVGRSMGAQAAHKKALSGEVMLVDIRSPEEWKETGIPASGHAITMHQDSGVFLDKLLALTKGSTDKPIALICASGARSTHMHEQLTKLGFKNVINVTEGMSGGDAGRGWIKEGLPVSKWQTPVPSKTK